MTPPPKRVAVIGAGTMGRGIAQAFATAGWQVGLSDALPDALPSARAAIDATLQSAVSRQKLAPGARSEILGRIQCCASLSEACQGAEVVVEAVVEDLATKCGVLREAAGPAVPQALLATNTSSLSVTEIAKSQPRPDRVIGLHFFNPVHVMRLVEVVVPDHCPEQTRSQALDLVRALGKEAIVVKDSPGFASSRLGVVLGLEAMRMLEQGIASAADIDRAMELGYNHPMGPLRLTDLVGLDVRLRIAEHLYRSLGGSQFEPPSILRRLVAEGRLGRKTGGGFYDYPNHE